jgi:hypothetical protein
MMVDFPAHRKYVELLRQLMSGRMTNHECMEREFARVLSTRGDTQSCCLATLGGSTRFL